MPENLRNVAMALRALEMHLGASIALLHDVSAENIAVLDGYRDNLGRLAAELETHVRSLDTIDSLVADRMNNFLMTMQIVSDRLRDAPVEHELRDQVRMTIDHGRATVSHIRKTLAELA